jgi:hypothetical protein|tara:strand:- start:468 stop:599 length:132 start_codon:yes stop_codon:yes gene_type:complete
MRLNKAELKYLIDYVLVEIYFTEDLKFLEPLLDKLKAIKPTDD